MSRRVPPHRLARAVPLDCTTRWRRGWDISRSRSALPSWRCRAPFAAPPASMRPSASMRGYGVREIATGVAILRHARRDAVGLGPGRRRRARYRNRRSGASRLARRRPQEAVVRSAPWLAVTALDLFCASCLSAEEGGRRTARADYRDRSGFPRGPQAARGAARDFEIPRDIRGPEALRPQATEGARHPAAPSGEWVTSRAAGEE